MVTRKRPSGSRICKRVAGHQPTGPRTRFLPCSLRRPRRYRIRLVTISRFRRPFFAVTRPASITLKFTEDHRVASRNQSRKSHAKVRNGRFHRRSQRGIRVNAVSSVASVISCWKFRLCALCDLLLTLCPLRPCVRFFCLLYSRGFINGTSFTTPTLTDSKKRRWNSLSVRFFQRSRRTR